MAAGSQGSDVGELDLFSNSLRHKDKKARLPKQTGFFVS